MTETPGPSQSTLRPVFIVRLWWEPDGATPGAGEWRGSVELLGTDKRFYFRELAQVSEIIAAALGEIAILKNFTEGKNR
jgi:hypothetical protein